MKSRHVGILEESFYVGYTIILVSDMAETTHELIVQSA